MPYNYKSLGNLDKGHRWQPGESGNPGGRPKDNNSKAGKHRRFRALKMAYRGLCCYGGSKEEGLAIVEGMYSLATKEKYVNAMIWFLNTAYGRPR
jgi:hypothetical protein